MEKVKRNERVAILIKTLSDNPNKLYTLSYFCELFDAAKSTISEDAIIAKEMLRKYDKGVIETVAGAAGGLRYLHWPSNTRALTSMQELCEKLSNPSRLLPGSFLYMQDIFSDPVWMRAMSEILARQFHSMNVDFIVTMETKGIALALMVANTLGKKLVVVTHDNKPSEGPSVQINYFTKSSVRVRQMSLNRRAVKEGQKALIIDDYLKGGGTAKGIMNMMKEFSVTVAGVGVAIATAEPKEKMISNYKTLLVMEVLDEEKKLIRVSPSDWLRTKGF